jgi:type III secretion protein S
MTPDALANEVYQFLFTALIATGPFLVAAAGIGLVIGIILAVIQIQEQSVPQIIKIAALIIMIVLFAAPLSMPFYNQSLRIFSSFHVMVR